MELSAKLCRLSFLGVFPRDAGLLGSNACRLWENCTGHTVTVLDLESCGVRVRHPDGTEELQPYDFDGGDHD